MKKFGLIGKNISYTLSPILHRKISTVTNNCFDYSVFDVENLYKFFENRELNGVNITIPYKKEVLRFVDFISEEVKEIGATNCLKISSNRIEAYNTDYFGVIKTFEKMKLNLLNKDVYILGTGGASLAVAKALKDVKANIFFVSRNPLNRLEKEYKIIDYDELKERKGELLINATPVGTYPNIENSPVSKEIIKNFNALFDLVYNPKETKFLKYGKELGKQVENGVYMLIIQAIKSHEIWFNRELDYNMIYNAIKEEI